VNQQELLVDCLRRLNSASIRYRLTGSMASNYWGMPRTTHDIDFVIQLPPSQAVLLASAFSGDYFLDEQAIRAAYQPPFQFNAIDMRSTMKIVFWLLRPEPFEREMFSRRIEAILFGEKAWISTAEDVILHKLYWNDITPSDRQLGDAAGIVAVRGEQLDRQYMSAWAKELRLEANLQRLLTGELKPKST
jgi:hypothetical protein